MKTNRRHELETNLLADRVGHSIDTAKPYLGWVFGGLLALAGLGLIYNWWQGNSLANASAAWTEFFFADGKPQSLPTIYEEYPSSTAALWARLAEADLLIANGQNDIYTDRDKADESFKKSQASYEFVVDHAREPLMRERATFGLAQVLESQCKPEEAAARYREIIKMGSSVQPSLIEEVERRLKWINGESGKEFFAMFKGFRPSLASPLGIPKNLNNLPDSPNISMPDLEKLKASLEAATGSGAPNSGGLSVPPLNPESVTGIPSPLEGQEKGGTFIPPPSNPESAIGVPPAPSIDIPAIGAPEAGQPAAAQ